jgi:hypothetical protein
VKISSNVINCEIMAENLISKTELVLIGLSLNESLKELSLSPINATELYLKEPISLFGVQKTISSDSYLKNFTLEFDDVRNTNFVSFTNYSVIVSPEFHSPLTLTCYYDSLNPKCMIPSLYFDYVPVKLSLDLKVLSLQNNHQTLIPMDFIYHKENVSISQEHPFLIDVESYALNPVSILFNVSKQLNPLYSFYCKCLILFFTNLDGNTLSKAQVSSIKTQYRCDIQPKVSDVSLNVSLWLNESMSNGLGGLLSFVDSKILFSSFFFSNLYFIEIRFDPRLIEINSLSTIKLVEENSQLLNVPSQYQSNSYQISSSDGSIKFGCSADSTNVKCQKSAINANTPGDIYFLSFQLFSKNVLLTPIHDKIMIYSNFL